jgi:hypothetical protein
MDRGVGAMSILKHYLNSTILFRFSVVLSWPSPGHAICLLFRQYVRSTQIPFFSAELRALDSETRFIGTNERLRPLDGDRYLEN